MYYFIINSKMDNIEEIFLKIKSILDIRKIEYRFYFTSQVEGAKEIANKISINLKEDITLIILGGDGTLNEVINGLHNLSYITLSVFPMGTGNDFVRSYKKGFTIESEIESVLKPKEIVEYNIAEMTNECGNRKYIVSSGIGFDATITYYVNIAKNKGVFRNKYLNKFTYVLKAIKTIINFSPIKIKVSTKKGHYIFENVYFCVVMNTAYEGKGVKLSPEAKGNDGILDLCIFNTKSKLKLIFLTLLAFKGFHTFSKSVIFFRDDKFEINASEITHCHVDGEQLGKSNWVKHKLFDGKIKIITK